MGGEKAKSVKVNWPLEYLTADMPNSDLYSAQYTDFMHGKGYLRQKVQIMAIYNWCDRKYTNMPIIQILQKV